MDRHPAPQEADVVQHFAVQRNIGLDAFHDHFGQRDAHAADGLLAVGAVGDYLADHRVVVGRHAVAQLRLDDRQGNRLRRQPRAGHRPHARRAVRNGRGRHPDQYSAAPRNAERHPLPARRRVDPLPRAEARPGTEKEEMMPWLSLTLQVDAAAAERFTQALLDAGAQSVSLENPQAGLQAVGALVGMNVDADALVRDAASAAGLENAPAFRADQVEDQDWVRRSQAQFAPLEIGARLWIGPSWHEPPADGRAVVRLDPGLAFGTGSHPTTRLVLRFLERELRGGEGVLDYGCGSGILAIAAAKLGAARVDAVDIDPQALDATAANARANRAAVRASRPEALAPQLYDVVVSNILRS